MSALSGRKDGEPITAAHIQRAEAILRNPSHPEYPQWSKDRDVRVRAIEDWMLAPIVVRIHALTKEAL